MRLFEIGVTLRELRLLGTQRQHLRLEHLTRAFARGPLLVVHDLGLSARRLERRAFALQPLELGRLRSEARARRRERCAQVTDLVLAA